MPGRVAAVLMETTTMKRFHETFDLSTREHGRLSIDVYEHTYVMEYKNRKRIVDHEWAIVLDAAILLPCHPMFARYYAIDVLQAWFRQIAKMDPKWSNQDRGIKALVNRVRRNFKWENY